LPGLLFNPARFFSLYLDRVALLHSKSDTPSDLLFPFCRYFSKVEHSLDKPVSYMSCLSISNFLLMKQRLMWVCPGWLHCMRRGGVTHAVRAWAPHPIVQKYMRVKFGALVGYHKILRGEDLEKATKLAF
jgi:hypothetical protein